VRKMHLFGFAVLTLGLFVGSAYRAADKDSDDKPKYTIKQAMKIAHGKADKKTPSLSDKVLAGEASSDEKAKLLELYNAVAANKAPKGDADAWKEKTTGIVDAIKGVVDSKENAEVDLRKALNCKSCHMTFRGR
jgi:hypothetical protein